MPQRTPADLEEGEHVPGQIALTLPNPYGPAIVTHGDAANLILPDECVDLIVTSPPYFGLRSYQDACPDCEPAPSSRPAPDSYVTKQCRACGHRATQKVCPRCGGVMRWLTAAERAADAELEVEVDPGGDPDCGTCGGSGSVHYAGQIGDEASPGEYLDALIACTREWCRVLKPGGSIFVNLGDKYAGGGGFSPDSPSNVARRSDTAHQEGRFTVSPSLKSRLKGGGVSPKNAGVRDKSLIGLPWRYALRCVDELGLILRAEIVWAKPNGLPESVTDRVRRSHEQVFHFVKQPRYYSAVDEVREPHLYPLTAAQMASAIGGKKNTVIHGNNRGAGRTNGEGAHDSDSLAGVTGSNPLGKLPGSVWEIPTAPLKVPESLGVDHFAAYPPELVRRIVLGWSPREVCAGCGEGRRPVVETRASRTSSTSSDTQRKRTNVEGGAAGQLLGLTSQDVHRRMLGYACACTPYVDHPGTADVDPGMSHEDAVAAGRYASTGAGWGGQQNLAARPRVGPWREYLFDGWTPPPMTRGVVLDPFGGTGTTALVASTFGRVGISVDLSLDYVRLARWRTTDPRERAGVLGVDRPKPVAPAQLGLFEGLT